MNFAIFITVFLAGLSLSVDAFAVSVSDGMVYRNLNKRNGVIIPLTFGLFQAVMPIIGYYIYKLFSGIEAFTQFDHWVGFALLVFIGGKMIFDGIHELIVSEEEITPKKFSFLEVFIQGIATSIDALALGFTLGTGLLQNATGNMDFWAWISVAIIGVTTFIVVTCGTLIGVKVGKLFTKKASVATIIGGVVLLAIAVKIVVGSYVALPF